MFSSQALAGSSSFLVDWQCENVGPAVITGQNVDFVVVVVHSFREFYKATSNCNRIKFLLSLEVMS